MALVLIAGLCTAVPVAPAAAALPLTFAAVGDHGSSDRARGVFRAVGATNPDFLLSLGDLSYDSISPSSWCQLVKDELNGGAGKPVNDPFGETYPVALTEGNHDSATMDQYVASGCLPDRIGASVAPQSTYGTDYYLDQPASAPVMRVIVTSPGIHRSYSAGSSDYRWVSDRIDAARAEGIRWIVVANHLNYISAGSKLNEIGGDFFNLLVAKKVDLVLQGHDHTYQRSKQLALGPDCPDVPTGRVAQGCIVDDGSDNSYRKGEGPVLLINGTGGVPNYPMTGDDPEAGYFARARGGEQAAIFGYSRFTVTESELRVSYVSVSGGSFADDFVIDGGAPPLPDMTPPSAPSGLVGSSDPLGTRVDLQWAAATDDRGVTGYQVVRDGVALAATVTGTSFSDSSVVAGRTYVYQVRAMDAAANVGPDSASVSVSTPAGSPAVYSETWSGPTGSVWPSPPWSSTAASGGAVQVQGGGGRLAVANQSGAYARSVADGVQTLADADLLMSYQWNDTTPSAYFSIYLRGTGGWQNAYRPRNGYGLQLASNSSTVSVHKNVNNIMTSLRSVPGGTRQTTAKQWLRFRVSGQQLMFRTWLDGNPEPTTWAYSGTDTSLTAPGHAYTSLVRGSTNTTAKHLSLDDLTLSRPE